MTQWYYADAAGTQQGPIDAEALLAQYAAAEVTPDTLVWREGLADWQPLSTLASELGLAEANLPVTAPSPSEALTVAPAEVVYAGFWRRWAANLIDGFAIALVTLPFIVPMMIAAVLGSRDHAGAIGMLLLQVGVQLATLVATVAYFTFFHASRLMASPGKLAVGIKVVRSDGQRLNFGRSLGRGFAYYLGYLTLYIGFLIAAFTQRKQALHDLICDTLVVDRWAFTDQPHKQQRGLDVVTIVLLAFYGVILLILLILLIVLAAVAAAALYGASR